MRLVPRRLAGLSLVLAIAAAFAFDASRAPAAQWSTRAALAGIHLYQRTASSHMGAFGVRCRFTPTCSRYAEVVLGRHGILRGAALTFVRLARCGPWTKEGTVDAPP